MKSTKKVKASLTLALLSLALGAVTAFGQGEAQMRNVSAGQKLKIKGIVVSRQDNNLVVRDAVGVDTKVALAGTTSVKSKGGFLRGGKAYTSNDIVRGLNLEVEGTGDSAGALVANKVRFDGDDLRTAKSIDSRVAPAEERLTQAEQNAQRLSGQIDELVAVSNAARGGAKAAQDTADAAVAGVNATNSRITSLDDYAVQSEATVNFRVGSALLSPEAKTSLDGLAQSALATRGYVVEVTGFASADGDSKKNKALSQRRADAVIAYLVETHGIPLRRIITPYGFGELQAVADNTTREGRAQNRRVEVKVLISKGLNQNVEVKPAAPAGDNPTNNQ
jgi:outer membrane protein OmpA-like peptidoglycan-associated protein